MEGAVESVQDGVITEAEVMREVSLKETTETEIALENVEEVVSPAKEEFGPAMESQLSVNGTEPVLKRRRSTFLEDGPSVHVSYKCLTRESRKKLQEVLRQWAEWQGHTTIPSNGTDGDSFESGSEMYFPALQMDPKSNYKMPFWMDLPVKQSGELENGEISLSDSQERESDVPLYDRACNTALSSHGSTSQLDGTLENAVPSRCFNCGSYSHALKDCSRPRDNAAINAARKLHASKKGSTPGSRGSVRYYQSSPGGKFDDLKPGILGVETRQSLGIGELDPPPWLNRMRKLGYPPGYLDEGEEEPSGITIFDGEEYQGNQRTSEDGEIMDTGLTVTNESVTKKMVVGFPGLNAPVPENADEKLWKQSSDTRHDFIATHNMHLSMANTSSQHVSTRNFMDSPQELSHQQAVQAQFLKEKASFTGNFSQSPSNVITQAPSRSFVRAEDYISAKSSPVLHRSLSDNSRRGRTNEGQDPSLTPREYYKSTSELTSYGRHDGLLSHPLLYLPPRSPAPYMHSPSQRSPSPGHTYDGPREQASLRPHSHTPPALLHSQRYAASSYQRSRNM